MLLTSFFSALGAVLSGIATIVAVVLAYKVHKSQKLLAQRQLLLPLWDYMSTLRKIDARRPIAEDVIKAVNTLELVALCCEGGMIDDKVVKRTFREQFIEHYEDIEKCSTIPGAGGDGRWLLRQNRSAEQFYRILDKERVSRDQM